MVLPGIYAKVKLLLLTLNNIVLTKFAGVKFCTLHTMM